MQMTPEDPSFSVKQLGANPHQEGEFWWSMNCGPLSEISETPGGMIGLEISATTSDEAEAKVEAMFPGATFEEPELLPPPPPVEEEQQT